MLSLTEKIFNKTALGLVFLGLLIFQWLTEFRLDYFSFKEIIPGVIAFLGFIFATRTFLLFKLKDSLSEDKDRQKTFEKMKAEGIIPREESYFSKLNRLDQYFHITQLTLCVSIIVIALAKLAKHLIIFNASYITSREIFSMISNAAFFLAVIVTTAITILTGQVLRNIIQEK